MHTMPPGTCQKLACMSRKACSSWAYLAASAAARNSNGARSSGRRPAHACATMLLMLASFTGVSMMWYSLQGEKRESIQVDNSLGGGMGT